jgi:hypothetical protein
MSMPRRAYNILRGYVGREWDRIQGIEREYAQRELQESLDAPVPSTAQPKNPLPVDEKARARRILGVGEAATFAEVRKAFERLHSRSDPARFPPNSEEARKAADIHRRVAWAYEQLADEFDVTDRRFGTLEID